MMRRIVIFLIFLVIHTLNFWFNFTLFNLLIFQYSFGDEIQLYNYFDDLHKIIHAPIGFFLIQLFYFPHIIFQIIIYILFIFFQSKRTLSNPKTLLSDFSLSVLLSWILCFLLSYFVYDKFPQNKGHNMYELFYFNPFVNDKNDIYGLAFVIFGNILFAIWFLPLWHYWLRDRVLN